MPKTPTTLIPSWSLKALPSMAPAHLWASIHFTLLLSGLQRYLQSSSDGGARAQGPKVSVHSDTSDTPEQILGQCINTTGVSGLESKFLSPPKACWIRISASEAQKPALLTSFPGDSHTPKSKKDHPRFIKFHTYPHAYIVMIAKIFIEHLRCARKYSHVLTQFALITRL